MRAELGWVEPNTCHPFLHKSCILPCGQSSWLAATCKKELSWFAFCQPQVLSDCQACLLGQFELDRPASLTLTNDVAINSITAWRNILYTDGNNITASLPAIDRKVERRKIANFFFELEFGANGPNVLWSKGWTGADHFPFVPRFTIDVRIYGDWFLSHGFLHRFQRRDHDGLGCLVAVCSGHYRVYRQGAKRRV